MVACYNGQDVSQTPPTAPVVTVVEDEPPATPAQIKYLTSLASQKLDGVEASRTINQANEGHWGRRSISDEINRLKDLPRHPAKTPVRGQESHGERQTPVDLDSGMYQVGETIYKVVRAVHGSGQMYAKRLTQSDECRVCGYPLDWHGTDRMAFECEPKPGWRFEYAPGAIREIRPEHKMTLEAAQKFGQLYGVCCQCGTTLTKEESIEKGIGPICEAKFA